MVEKKAGLSQVPSAGNYHHRNHGRPKNRQIASGVRDPAKTCCWRNDDGSVCGSDLAFDSYAYCELHKIEVRRSV